MAMKVSRVDVWAATIKDRPGGVAEKLRALAKAGANLEFVIARRTPEKRSKGVVFLTPLKGAKQTRAARAAGFAKTKTLHSVRVEGPDRRGFGAALTECLSAADINLRGISAAAMGKRCIVHLAFDKSRDATAAVRLLKKLQLVTDGSSTMVQA